jgi:hypothetical protein
MFELLDLAFAINENANLREELEKANKRLARLPLEQRMAAIQAENLELKIRLGVIIRLLAEKGVLDVKEMVEAFNRFKTPAKGKVQAKPAKA